MTPTTAALRQLHGLAKTRAFGGAVGADLLIKAGLDALLAGVDAPSLAWLAGLGRNEEPEAPAAFDAVLEELGLTVPAPGGPAAAEWAMACWIAEQMLDGSVEPAAGADRIWLHCTYGRHDPGLLGPMMSCATGLAESAEEGDSERFAVHEVEALRAARVLLGRDPGPSGQPTATGGSW